METRMVGAIAEENVERWVLDQWAGNATLAPSAYERALELAGLRPDRASWARFLDRLFASMGALLLASGLISSLPTIGTSSVAWPSSRWSTR